MELVDRRTGKLVDIPEAQAQAAFKSGMYGLPKGAQLPVSTPGNIGTVAAADAQKALDTGMSVADPRDFQRAQMENRYGGAGGTVGAAGAGFARGLGESVFLPTDRLAGDAADLLSGDIVHGGDPLRERLKAYEELHPVASMGGELGGLVAGSALTGGKGMGALGSVAEHLAPDALGRLGAGVARGAAEGGALGGIQAVNESALGDSDLNSEKVLASMGNGAIFGGALGGGLSGLGVVAGEARDAAGRYLAKLAPRDVESLATKTFGYAPEGLGSRVQKAYAKFASGIAGKDPDVVQRLTELSPEGAEARRVAVFDAPKIQEEAQRAVRENVDNLLRSGDLVSAEARGQLKADYVAKAVKTGNEDATRGFAQRQIQRIIDSVDGELAHPDGVAPQMVKSLETLSRASYRALDGLEGGNADLFVSLDNLKRSAQRLAKISTRSVRNIDDPLDQIAASRTAAVFRDVGDDLKSALEDTSLWGKAAEDQKTINAAWTKQIDASERFHKALTTDTVRDPNNAYQRLRGADPGKVESYVKNLTNPNNDLTHAAVKDFVQGSRDLSEAIAKSYDLPPDKLAEVQRVFKASQAFEGEIGKAEKSLVLANQFRALTEGTTDSLSAMLGTVGGVVGGLPGGMLGAAAGAVANPGRVVAQLAAVERLMTKVDARIGSSIRGFFRGGNGGAHVPALHEAATPEGFERFTKVLSSAVDTEGNITPAGRTQIAQAIGDLAEGAPKLAGMLTLAATRVATFLASKLPVAMQDPNDMFPGEEPPLVSDTERETFGRYAKAALDPTTVLDHLSRGDVTPEEAEALKKCYPRIYSQVRAELDAKVRDAQAKGKPLDYEKLVAYGTLFEVRTHATMGAEVLQMVSAARAKHGRRGGGMRGAMGMGMPRMRGVPTIAPRFQTTFEAASSRRKGGLI